MLYINYKNYFHSSEEPNQDDIQIMFRQLLLLKFIEMKKDNFWNMSTINIPI